jgi:hypothetical protein
MNNNTRNNRMATYRLAAKTRRMRRKLPKNNNGPVNQRNWGPPRMYNKNKNRMGAYRRPIPVRPRLIGNMSNRLRHNNDNVELFRENLWSNSNDDE